MDDGAARLTCAMGERAKKPVRQQKGHHVDSLEPLQEFELLLALVGLQSANRDESAADTRP